MILMLDQCLGAVYALMCMIFISLLARFTKCCRTLIEKVEQKRFVCRYSYHFAFWIPLIVTALPTLVQFFFGISKEAYYYGTCEIQLSKPNSIAELFICIATACFLLGVYSIAIREVRNIIFAVFLINIL
jgi:hypothetical protein